MRRARSESRGSPRSGPVAGRRDPSAAAPSPPVSGRRAGMVTSPMEAITPQGVPAIGHGQTMPPPPEASSIDRLVELVAGSNLSVIVLGETGVGKEVAAERIHRLST